MKNLVIYESPNKFKTFASMFEDMDVSFCFTQGRILDLPDDRMGIGNDLELELIPINDQRFNFLKNKIDNSSTVLCMTDNDAEGEWIASHIKSLCDESNVEFKRVRINELTKDSLKKALALSTEHLDDSLISLAQSRRLIDRIIGYHDNESKESKRGRVLTPAINSIHNEPLDMTSTLIAHEDGTEIIVEGNAYAIAELEALIKAGSIDTLLGKNSIPDEIELYNTIDFIGDRCMLSRKSSNEAFEELQHMYESGNVSYVRTENKKYEVLNGEHKGIHFLGKLDNDDTDDIDSNGLSLIKLRTLIHMNPDSFKTLSVEPSDRLRTFCEKNNLRIKRITKIEALTRSRHEVARSISPLFGTLKVSKKRTEVHVYKHVESLVLLNRLKDLEIGTPATYHMHAEKIGKLIEQKGMSIRLNSHGVRIAVQTDGLSNQLRRLDVTKEIDALIFNNTLSIEDRCKKCLNILRISEPTNSDFVLGK